MIKYRLKKANLDLLEVTKVVSRKTGSSEVTASVYSLCNEQNRILGLFAGKQKAEIAFKTSKSFSSEIYLEYHCLFHMPLSTFKFLIQQSIAFITVPCFFSDFQTTFFTKNWQNAYLFHDLLILKPLFLFEVHLSSIVYCHCLQYLMDRHLELVPMKLHLPAIL